jgi:putative transposase
MWYYSSRLDDAEVERKLAELAEAHPTRGFDSYYGRIRSEGLHWNRKRVLRIYRKMNLTRRRKYKRRPLKRIKQELNVPQTINQCWSMDMMSDALTSGRRFRTLNVMDDHNREALTIEVGFSMCSNRVIEALERIIDHRGAPKVIRTDNGPEFTSHAFRNWCKEHVISNLFIQPGKPAQNAYIERFNRLFREDILDAYLFEDLAQVRILAEKWMDDYNRNHPHSALAGNSPLEHLKLQRDLLKCGKPEQTGIPTSDHQNAGLPHSNRIRTTTSEKV